MYVHGVRVREREIGRKRGRERGGGGRERYRGGGVKYQDTGKVLATFQLQVYARGFQLVLSPAWRARLVFSFDVSCFNTDSSSDVRW